MKKTSPLETATRKKIDQMLNNLGWNTDEFSKNPNVTTERAKTKEQENKLKKISGYKKPPDYVLYKSNSDKPIAIIESKRKGQDVEKALEQAKKLYANPLGVKIVFAYDGSFFKSEKIDEGKELKIDGIAVTGLLSEKQILRFTDEGHSISEATPEVKHSRTELINVFRYANNTLRKEGLREGIERFTEFSNILFLKLISEIEDEREKEGGERVINEQFCWNKFNKKDADDMYYYVSNTVLKELRKEYGEIFDDKLKISANALKAIVDKLSKISLKNADSDVKGDAFEYFLKTSITLGNDLGEYFTPRHIVNLMIDIMDPKFGEKIYDPTCGTGGFLISTFNYIQKRSAKSPEVLKKLKEETVYGRELTSTARIAKMNMIITGDGHTNIEQIDSLDHPVACEYDVVVANPPYGQDTDYGDHYDVPNSSSDGIFLQHIVKSLKSGGRAAVVIPEGLLFRDIDLDLRKHLLQHCNIHAIISLPAGVFRPYAKGNKTDVIILEKAKDPKKPEGTKSVWFYDMTADGFDLTSDLRKQVDENDIPDLLAKWSDKIESDKSWNATIKQIEEEKYELTAKIYKKKIIFETNIPLIPFSNFLQENKESITIDDDKKYTRVTVKVHGNGIFLRDEVKGKDIRTKEQKLTKTNQLIIAEIDAKLGGYGIIPKDLKGSIVSSHYFLFDIDESKILPKYLDYVMRFGNYEEQIKPFVKGTTNYAAIRPKHVLQLTIPLPPIKIQNSIVERIDSQLRIKDNSDDVITSLENAGVDESFFNSYPKESFTKHVDINPKYKKDLNSKKYFVEMANIDEKLGIIRKYQNRESKSSGASRFKDNDILFARITPCTENGKIAIVGGLNGNTGIGSTEFVVLSPKKIIDSRWLYFFLKNNIVKTSAVESMNGTTGRQRVAPDFFQKLEIPILPLKVQKEQVNGFTKYLTAKRSLTELIDLSNSTINNIVTSLFQKKPSD